MIWKTSRDSTRIPTKDGSLAVRVDGDPDKDPLLLIAQRAPRAKLVLYPDAGHAFLFQYAEDFCAEVLRFLS
jgi:pimeloyl-ACP methyl ester carboxylesterase